MRWAWVLLCSAALLVPCFWHHHIQACDLGSHLYTAWLSQSVAQGYLPGLHLRHQYTNILIDILLARSLPYLGATGTQRFIAAFSVLTFFWGSFAFVAAAARKAAWNLTPLLAMISYGAIFHWGFFNFYLSTGFSLFGLALIVRGSRRELLLQPVILLLAALAHPMGAACLLALGLYLFALRELPSRYHLPLTLALFALSFAVRFYLVLHFEVLPREIRYFYLLGTDQLIVFGNWFVWIALATLAICALAVWGGLREAGFSELSPWLQFYLAAALVVAFAPGGLSSESTLGMMGYLPDRGSLYSAVALAALVARCRPRKWFALATALVAVFFFAGLYRDTAILQQRENKVDELVEPFSGRRIISIVPPVAGWRIHEDHSLDRACLGHCYSYNNYEPSTGQFRLVAEPGNRFVSVNQDALDAMRDGSYLVPARVLPLYEVYQCGAGVNDLCIAELRLGQRNGKVPNIVRLP